MTRDRTAVVHREADQPPGKPLLLLLHERLATHEVSLVDLREPGEVRLERRDGVVDVVAVERHSHLETQRIACS